LQSRPIIQPKKPLFIVISAPRISDYGRDIKVAMIPLYHWIFPIPHADEKMMENVLVGKLKTGIKSLLLRGSLL
jgi:hypothetical protein